MAKEGDRVRLICTSDPYTKLKPGDEGVVYLVDAIKTVHVEWDNGGNLGLVPGVDLWEVVKKGDGNDKANPKQL
jgi:hypothetical protein